MAVEDAWEKNLLALALAEEQESEAPPGVTADPARLDRAFSICSRITSRHSRTFHLASALLPSEKRKATRALYAFCRHTDDLVDQAGSDRAEALAQWRRRLADPCPPDDDPVFLAWARTRAAYRIPIRYPQQLIDGVARDLVTTRYATFDDLAEYCYGVASTVGLMSMHIIGFAGPEAVPYAIKMGVALQMTNILRDVGEDWQRGRLYLPQDDLASFGLTEDDVAREQIDDNWRFLMRFQIERAHRLYDESWPGIALLNRDGQFAIAAAADLYRAILGAIEANDYDVFRRRAHIGMLGKIGRLPGIWRRLRRLRRETRPTSAAAQE